MALIDLEISEREIIRQCIQASVDGPFFPDEEFHTLFGLWRSEVKAVLEMWPKLDDSIELVRAAINNSLVNLIYYPHGCEQEWPNFISVQPDEVARVFTKWNRESLFGQDYIDNLV